MPFASLVEMPPLPKPSQVLQSEVLSPSFVRSWYFALDLWNFTPLSYTEPSWASFFFLEQVMNIGTAAQGQSHSLECTVCVKGEMASNERGYKDPFIK